MSENKDLNSSKQKDSAKVDKYSTFENFDENTHRVRRNLLIFSVIALFYKLSGATLKKESSFFGLQFENVNPEMIDLFLLWIVIYHLIHFAWLAFEHCQHNIVGLTRVGKKDIKGNLGEINLKDDTWNLYLWWKKNYSDNSSDILKIDNFLDMIKCLDELVLKIIDDSKNEPQKLNDGYVIYIANKIKNQIKHINSTRHHSIQDSLSKFDKGYKNYSLTNRLRWLVLEIGIPVLMGLSAVGFLSSNIFNA